MKTLKAKRLLACFMAVLVLMTSLSISIASAETDGTFNYTIYNEYDADFNSTKCVKITGYTGTSSEVVIPEEIAGYPVTMIYDRAFAENKTITSVSIPDSVKKIGMEVFRDCENLSEITLPTGLEEIGGYILMNTAYSLDSANWDGELLYINNYLLMSTDQVTGDLKLKDGTTFVADFAFSFNRTITSVTIPASVKIIGSYAFSSCDKLSSVTFNEGTEIIGFGSFEGTNLSEVTIPQSVTTLEGWAFADTKLESIDISANVKDLDDTSFDGCTSLKSINVDESNPIYYSTDGILFEKSKYDFLGDYLLIYPSAKEGHSYTIPENVEYLGYNAFSDLVYLKDLNVPAKVDIFSGLHSDTLENINIDEAHEDYKSVDGVVYSKDGTILICFPGGKNVEKYEVASTVKETTINAVTGCVPMKEITFPEGFEKLSEASLYFCENLTTINLPSTLTEVEDDFFRACYVVTTINFNGTKAQWEAFDTSVYFPSYEETEGIYVYCTDGEIELVAPHYEDDFTLPTEPEVTTTAPTEPEVTTTAFTEPQETTTVPATSENNTTAPTTTTEPQESVTTTATEPKESSTAPADDKEFETGDANMDGKLNIRDATAIQKHLAKVLTLGEEALELADFNGDAKVNIKDATTIQKRIAGIV